MAQGGDMLLENRGFERENRDSNDIWSPSN